MVGGWTTGSSLVGRGEELAAFDAALEHARGGDPVTVLLGGEAGIGKTRLVDEFSGRAFAQGARLLSGACVDLADAALPYGAVVDALRAVPVEAYEPLAPAVRRELAALVPEAAPDDLPYDGAQGGLFGALLRLLEQLGREEPLVLVLEDLHWADPSTRDLVSFLARGLRQTAVLLVVTYRTDEIDREHPVRRLLASLQRAPGVRSWDLGPMTREETARHLAAVADTQLDAEVVDAIHRRSEGNPFFAEELLAARDRGTLSSSLRDALLLRLDRLSAAAQGVVRVAATVGRDVDHELLREVAELPDDALDLALRECVDAHVLRVDAAGRGYRFRHALLQEVAAEELLPGERRRLHERIADR
ncbi:MAG TPA: AAA family ATPase, partial [Solirubrobacteraceae bacterium]|nr:AAA family ATPase [Solirubrobacteraceae bacterium]